MKRISVALVTALAVASCTEHFPRSLFDDDASAPIPDAAAGEDAAPPVAVGDAAVPDATLDAAAPDGDATATTLPEAGGSCNVTLASPAPVASPHIPEGSPTSYATNPPSSGPHYPVWANFQEFTTVVPDGYLVHSLEHGAVELLYDCDVSDPTCASMVADLRKVRDAVPDDPSCVRDGNPSSRVRIIIAHRPTNDSVIAAAAWGQTYHADCVDIPSLTAFANAYMGKGTEDLCYAGRATF